MPTVNCMNIEIIVPALLMCMTWCCYVLRKRCTQRTVKLVACLLFLVYVLGYLIITIFSRKPVDGLPVNLLPFKTYVGMYQTICYATQIGESVISTIFAKEFAIDGVIQNILLYYPLGYLLPILFPRIKVKHVILVGCLCSIATEISQYIFRMGWCETDDVIHNMIGTGIGVGVWYLQSRGIGVEIS